MLTPDEIVEVAVEFKEEVRNRKYVEYIMAPGFVEESQSWQMIIEVMEIVLHRRGLYIVPQELVKEDAAPRLRRFAITGEEPAG